LLPFQIPILRAEEVEGAVDVEGVGVQVEVAMVVMVDMETKVGTAKVVDIMIIKVDMIIKEGMVVDMATTKADMETIKVLNGIGTILSLICSMLQMVTYIYLLNQKMVDIEAEGVCMEEATIITVVARCHILVLLNALLKLMF
jgi:hypothetical protein